MVDKKNGNKKKSGGNKPPMPPISPVDRAGGLGKSSDITETNQPKSNNQVDETAIIKLTGALVRWTAKLTVATIALGILAFFQWRELSKTDDTLHETLFVSQRPWLSVNTTLDGPLTINENRASIALRVAIKNVGHSPASIIGIVTPMTNIGKEQSEVYLGDEECTQAFDGGAGYVGGPQLFPDETILKNLIATTNGRNPVIGKTWDIYIRVCVKYSSSLITRELKTTSTFQLGLPNPVYRESVSPLNMSNEPISQSILVFKPVATNAE